MPNLKIYKTFPNIELPKIATEQSACFDLAFSSLGKFEYTGYNERNRPFTLPFKDGKLSVAPGHRVMVPTGLIFDIPKGYSVRLYSRSGLSLKQGLVLVNSVGVIDSDYVDEVFVLMSNLSTNNQWLNPGDRIAQAEIIKNETCKIEETTVRPILKSDRVGGFGSTGVTLNVTNTTVSSN
jgi:dUTP pyrophosphatase